MKNKIIVGFLASVISAFGQCHNGAVGSDTTGLPNTGVRATISVIPNGTTWYWISEVLDNGMWGQIGYQMDVQGNPKVFWQVWDAGNNWIATGPVKRMRLSNGPHTFSMSLKRGTTWEFKADSKDAGSFDMQSAVSYGGSMWALGEGLCSAPIQVVTFSKISILRGGAWLIVPAGYTFGGYYGVQGYLQNPSIPPGGFQRGGVIPITGGKLW